MNTFTLLLLIVLVEIDEVEYLSDHELMIGAVDVPVTDMFVPALTDVTRLDISLNIAKVSIPLLLGISTEYEVATELLNILAVAFAGLVNATEPVPITVFTGPTEACTVILFVVTAPTSVTCWRSGIPPIAHTAAPSVASLQT